MSTSSRAAALLAVALLSAGCAGTSASPDAAPSPSPSTQSVVPSQQSTPSASATTAAPPGVPGADRTIRITYAHGKVSGVSGRVSIRRGSTVALVVTSDVADEVHLHGYDKHVDVPKGGTATLLFKATIPGVFEAELEALKKRLVQLQVR
jgi:hypothetical protein